MNTVWKTGSDCTLEEGCSLLRSLSTVWTDLPSLGWKYLLSGDSVQFRTTPVDSTGVPHILEHTVLCGSEKYPCRDPFFKMLNRSLSTFMNAFTGTPPVRLPRSLPPRACVLLVWLYVAWNASTLFSFETLSRSEWLHHVPVLHAERQGLSQLALCLFGRRLLSLPPRAGLPVRMAAERQRLCRGVSRRKITCRVIHSFCMPCKIIHSVFFFLAWRQEGWRLENEDPTDPTSPLVFKGVVFNEMKGAFVSRPHGISDSPATRVVFTCAVRVAL